MIPVKRITDPTFVYIPSANHDADSTKFRQRQLERIAAAEKARAEVNANVKPLGRKKA